MRLVRVVGAVALGMLCACSSDDGTSESGRDGAAAPRQLEIAPSLAPDDSVSPLYDLAHAAFPGGEVELNNERERRIAECMQRRGWEWQPVPQGGENESRPRTYGELLAWTQQYGYGQMIYPPPSGPDPKTVVDTNVEYLDSLPADERAQFERDYGQSFGDEESSRQFPGGCIDEAEEALEAMAPYFNPAVVGRINRELDASSGAPEMQEAERRWSECMATAGYSYAVPADSIREISLLDPPADTHARQELAETEIAVATADLDCKRSTTLPVQVAIEARAVDRVIEDHPEYATLAP